MLVVPGFTNRLGILMLRVSPSGRPEAAQAPQHVNTPRQSILTSFGFFKASRPGGRAEDLAKRAGFEKARLKTNIRKLKGIGKVVKWGRQVAFTEGELYDAEGRLLAKATGTAIPTPFKNYK